MLLTVWRLRKPFSAKNVAFYVMEVFLKRQKTGLLYKWPN